MALTCLAVFALAGVCHGINLRFDHLTIEDGLSHSKVNTIHQDKRGYMWFGTNDGLNRYDGYTFSSYQHSPADETSLSHNLVRHILEDREGNLWVATDAGGLNLYRRDRDSFERIQHDPDDPASLSSNNINMLAQDRSGSIWVASRNGLNLFDPVTRTSQHFPREPGNENSPSGDMIQTLLLDSGNRLWIGYDGDGLDCLYLDTGKFVRHNRASQIPLPVDAIYALFEDSQRNIWAGSDRDGVWVFRPGGQRWEQIRPSGGELIPTTRVITEDDQRNVWIGCRGGLYVYNLGSGELELHDSETEGTLSLSHSSVLCVFKDRNEDYWLGTRGGVNYFNRGKAAFRIIPYIPNNDRHLNSPMVYGMYEDPDGDLWIGTETGGINRRDAETGRFTYYLPGESGSETLSALNVKTVLLGRDGRMWFGTFDGGLNRLDVETGKFKSYQHEPENDQSISNDDVYSIAEDANGDLWVATHLGVNRLSISDETFSRFEHSADDPGTLSHDDCKVVYFDRAGRLWVGTFWGLNLFEPETESWRRYLHDPEDPSTLSNPYVQALYEDAKGRFWVGTQGGGLNLMDRDTGRFTAFREGGGLANNAIYGILEDRAGNLWLSTNDGISKFNPETKEFRNYDVDDGLSSNQFSYNAYHQSASGELFFGGIKGVNSFVPEAVRDNDYVPAIVFTELFVFNEAIVAGDETGLLQQPVSETESIVISHRESVITFGFAALSYNSSRDNRYAYFLEGFDSEWHEIGTRREVTFTNLDPGDYVLRVRASNNHGVWNDEGISMAITILPPFWGTVWFRLLAVGLVTLAIYGLYRARTRAISDRNLELQAMNLKLERAKREISDLNVGLEEKVEKRTSELMAVNRELESFAYSVSHDLRTPLRGINGFSQALLDDYGDKLDAEGVDHLHRVRDASIRMGGLIDALLNMSRIVRREMVHVEVDLTKLIQTIADELQASESDRQATVKLQDGMTVTGDPNLLRIAFENILRNAWKYCRPRQDTRIEVGIDSNHENTIYIRDNGVGFDMAYERMLFEPFQRLHAEESFKGNGIGLATVKRIISRHNGNVWGEGEADVGATFYVSIPSAGIRR